MIFHFQSDTGTTNSLRKPDSVVLQQYICDLEPVRQKEVQEMFEKMDEL